MTTPDPRLGKLYRFEFDTHETIEWRPVEGKTRSIVEYEPRSRSGRFLVRAIEVHPVDTVTEPGVERWTVEDPEEPEEGLAVIFVGPGRARAEAAQTGYIARGNKNAHTGFLRWPTHLRRDDLGCAVVAVVREKPHDEDPFQVSLATGSIALGYQDPVVTPEQERYFWPHIHDPEPMEEGVLPRSDKYISTPVLAAVTLGTCGVSFEGWRPTRADLTDEGIELVNALGRLYEREVELLLFVDT